MAIQAVWTTAPEEACTGIEISLDLLSCRTPQVRRRHDSIVIGELRHREREPRLEAG